MNINYIGKCVSFKNKNSCDRCNRKTKAGQIVCGYHKNSKKLYIDKYDNYKLWIESELDLNMNDVNKLLKVKTIFAKNKINALIQSKYKNSKNKITELDSKYNKYLIGGEYSWKEIPAKYRFKINKNEMWDIRFLLKHFTQQLNHSDMGNCSPQFPSNPFTRNIYNYKELSKFKNKINNLLIELHISMHEFFKMNIKLLLYKIEQRDNKYNYLSQKLVNHFNKNLRFKNINYKDSQDNYIGHWTKNTIKKTTFELLHADWISCPPYIQDITGNLINNIERQIFNEILLSCPSEEWMV